METLSSLLKLADANLDRKDGSIFAPLQTLERHDFPGIDSLCQPRDRCFVQGGIELARMHSDQVLAAVPQALAGLPIDVENDPLFAEQEETVHRMVDEAAKPGLARAQLILGPLALGDVAHQA